MSLTAFNRLRRIEAMKPENIKNAVEEVKEEVVAVKQEEVEEPELEDIKNEEEVSKPSTTARRRNIRRKIFTNIGITFTP